MIKCRRQCGTGSLFKATFVELNQIEIGADIFSPFAAGFFQKRRKRAFLAAVSGWREIIAWFHSSIACESC